MVPAASLPGLLCPMGIRGCPTQRTQRGPTGNGVCPYYALPQAPLVFPHWSREPPRRCAEQGRKQASVSGMGNGRAGFFHQVLCLQEQKAKRKQKAGEEQDRRNLRVWIM